MKYLFGLNFSIRIRIRFKIRVRFSVRINDSVRVGVVFRVRVQFPLSMDGGWVRVVTLPFFEINVMF